MHREYGHFYPKLVWIGQMILSLPMSNTWPETGASAVNGVGSRLQSSMTNQMLEALMYISINDQQSVKHRNLLKKLLSPGAKQRKQGNPTNCKSRCHLF